MTHGRIEVHRFLSEGPHLIKPIFSFHGRPRHLFANEVDDHETSSRINLLKHGAQLHLDVVTRWFFCKRKLLEMFCSHHRSPCRAAMKRLLKKIASFGGDRRNTNQKCKPMTNAWGLGVQNTIFAKQAKVSTILG